MISNVFTLVLATASIANAIPLFRGEPAPAQQLVRRAENSGQIAQGSNFYFQSLHIEDACTPGQVACVSGNYATCSGEANWEISPCATGTTCLAVPADSSSGVTVQCTTQDAATASINNAGGETNVVAADYHIVDAPFQAAVVPTATESVAAPTATESASATENASASESATATESASTEDPSATCVPDEDPEDPTETVTETPTATATEAPSPAETCTEEPEDPVETETITVILVPVPSQSGVYSTTTLFPEATAAPTESGSSSSASPTESSSSSDSSSASETASSTEAAPTEVYSYPGADPTPTESPLSDSATATEAPSSDNNSSSESTSETITRTTLIVPPPSAPTESGTSITISFPPDGSDPSIPPVNPPANPPAGQTPPIVVVGIHFIPAPSPATPAPTSNSGAVPVKRGMQKKIRRA